MSECFQGLEFLPMDETQIPALTEVMTRAFDDDSQRYFGTPHGGPDGYNDGTFLRQWGLESHAASYALCKDGKIAGGMILFVEPEKRHGFLGCLFVDPAYHHQGLGRTAWQFAEHAFPMVDVWNTETPAVSYRNHCFYINTCGFRVTHVNDPQDRLQAQFAMEKVIR